MNLGERLKQAFPKNTLTETGDFGPELFLDPGQLPGACERLHASQEFGLDILEDQTALDLGNEFVVVLRLLSSADRARRLTVKVPLPRDRPEVPSLSRIFGSAEWYEREIFDMFGIVFSQHPDLRRILLPEDWQGYPLRKDYADGRMLKRPGAQSA